MPDAVKKVDYYSALVADKVGEGARLLGALAEGGVDFTALWGYPLKGKNSQIDMVATNAAALKKAAKQAGITLGEKRSGVLVEGEDKPGAVAATLAKLAAAGINVRAVQALSAGAGRYSLMIEVDSAKAAKALVPAPPKKAPAKKK
jgi:hypothetical protein